MTEDCYPHLDDPYLMVLDSELGIDELARLIHTKDFGEEYDFMYDDTIDTRIRRRGENPMKREYIEEYTKKRLDLGVVALSESGMTTDGMPSESSFLVSYNRAQDVYNKWVKKVKS